MQQPNIRLVKSEAYMKIRFFFSHKNSFLDLFKRDVE